MGLIDRIKRITMAKLEAFLETVEKPEIVFPQLIREMQQKLRDATNAEAKALTSVRSAQRKFDQAAGRSTRLERTAKDFLATGNESAARDALAEQVTAEEDRKHALTLLDSAKRAADQAREAREQLQSDLEQLKERKKEILERIFKTRAEKARQGQAREIRVVSPDNTDLLSIVQEMEEKVIADESAVEVRQDVSRRAAKTPEQRKVDKLMLDAEIQRRLDQLRRGKEGR
ncbi:MAG: PspA/IM30 family protein [Phycisphaerae bacterium]